MPIDLLSLPEPDLTAAILNKMTARSFVHIRRSSKGINIFVEKNEKNIHVRANGCFMIQHGGHLNCDVTGFALQCITTKTMDRFNNPWTIAPITADTLINFQPILNRWTGRVLLAHRDYSISTDAANMLQPKTLITTRQTPVINFGTFQLDFLISNGTHVPGQLVARKALFQKLEWNSVTEIFAWNYLYIWWKLPNSPLKIFQASQIELAFARSLTGLADRFIGRRFGNVVVSEPSHWGEKEVIVGNMTKNGRSGVGAVWSEGSDDKKDFFIKFYFDKTDLTPEMLNHDAIYTE